MKGRIKSYTEFKVNETTEFNYQRLNSDSAPIGMPIFDNPQLSINAFDKHQNAIRTAVTKINTLLHSLSNTAQFSVLKSRLHLDKQNIQSMKILRISKSNDVNYDFYISFVIGEMEYFGVVENLLDPEPDFKSEVFKNTDLVQTKEWVIKIKGIIIKILKSWLKPENGKYRLINDYAICTNVETGKMLRIPNKAEVEVIRSYDNKIMIKHDNNYYYITGDNYIYFNYWFLKVN
jgi:hypothetical protein